MTTADMIEQTYETPDSMSSGEADTVTKEIKGHIVDIEAYTHIDEDGTTRRLANGNPLGFKFITVDEDENGDICRHEYTFVSSNYKFTSWKGPAAKLSTDCHNADLPGPISGMNFDGKGGSISAF